MIHDDSPAQLAAARNGDQEAFRRLTDPYRREILVHCYRMLGSIEDAEDARQETWLQAWRRLSTFEGRGTLRAWLYKIATNTSLQARAGRRLRSLPSLTHSPADPGDPLPAPSAESIWLEPFPDALLAATATNPEAIVDARESVGLAFLAALQHLPGRQRAVLILRDVLCWRAGEVAELLNASDVAVNSVLQRARQTMRTHRATWRDAPVAPVADEQTATLLADYVDAWETADVARLVSLLRQDATLTMPPVPAWFRGREAIGAFFAAGVFAGEARGRFRLVTTRANGCPAVAVYQRDEAGDYRPAALNVLEIDGDRIAEMHDFLALDDRLFARFGLPVTA
jgi:RNA polymerase sigma-70 factor (ECF subfamily)